MPIAIFATITIQIICIVHAVRTGRTQPWLYVIMFLPFVGSVAYFLVEVLPGIAETRRARNVLSNVKTVLDPDREYRDRLAQVELTGTPAAKSALADECARKGMHDDAIELYRSALTGLFADDPKLLVGFARVLADKPDFAECQRILYHLRDKNPDFNSTEGHLLYARALEGQGKNDEATGEYEALIGYFPGFEAKVRYALFLQKLARVERAKEILEGVVKSYKQQPRHAQTLNRDWYDVARRNLDGYSAAR